MTVQSEWLARYDAVMRNWSSSGSSSAVRRTCGTPQQCTDMFSGIAVGGLAHRQW